MNNFINNLSGIKLEPYKPAVIREICWNKPYETVEEQENVIYDIVELSCGHKAKLKRFGFYQGNSSCLVCYNDLNN